jgi:hypothetical protein
VHEVKPHLDWSFVEMRGLLMTFCLNHVIKNLIDDDAIKLARSDY